jgi:hypothetical protein
MVLLFCYQLKSWLLVKINTFLDTGSPADGAVCSSETLVSTFKFIRRYNPKDQYRHLHRRENLKSHINILFYFALHPAGNGSLESHVRYEVHKLHIKRLEVSVICSENICKKIITMA